MYGNILLDLFKYHMIEWVYYSTTCFILKKQYICRSVDIPFFSFFSYYNTVPMFECYVIWCGSKNIYQKDMCLKVSGLCAQNMITILDSIINIIGEPIRPLNEHEIVHFNTNQGRCVLS
jgi:hypothetical protein